MSRIAITSSAFRELSVAERLELLELLAHTLREEWLPPEPRPLSVAHLRGALKSDEAPPSDEEVAGAYTEHLLEKYR